MPSTLATSRADASNADKTLPHRQTGVDLADDTRDPRAPDASAGVAQSERLLRLRDVLAVVGMSRAHVYNLIKQGLFPRPIALGSNCARWVQSEVQGWVTDSIVAARQTHAARRSRRANSG